MDLHYLFENMSAKAGTNFLHHQPHIAIPYISVMVLACLFGTVGNVLVILAVCINKHLKTTCNIFIVNLAFADICVTAFVDPFGIIGVVRGEAWFLDRFVLCEVIASVCTTSCFCSHFSIGAISFNRYVQICHNYSYRRIYTTRNTLLICLGLWSVSFLLEVPNFIGWGDHVYDRKTQSCIWDRTAYLSYSVFVVVVAVAFPMVLIAICYAKLFLYVRKRRKTQTRGNASSRLMNESMRLAKTLFIIFVVFAICWTPYGIVVTCDMDDSWVEEIHMFAILLAHTNSSLNCVLYGLTNRHFRNEYIRCLNLAKCLNSSTCQPRMIDGADHESQAIMKCKFKRCEKNCGNNDTQL